MPERGILLLEISTLLRDTGTHKVGTPIQNEKVTEQRCMKRNTWDEPTKMASLREETYSRFTIVVGHVEQSSLMRGGCCHGWQR